MKTVGHITRAITRAFRKYDKAGKPCGPMPNWFKITRRHFEQFGKAHGKKVEVSGPFGLRCAFLVKLGRKAREFEMDNHRGWHIGRRDYQKQKNEFRPGSIGAINGMNFQYELIPNSTPLERLFL
jgi:hypothetical protein